MLHIRTWHPFTSSPTLTQSLDWTICLCSFIDTWLFFAYSEIIFMWHVTQCRLKDRCQCSGGRYKVEWSRRYLQNGVFVQFCTFMLAKFPHKLAWNWSWTVLLTVRSLTIWTTVRRKSEVLIRNGVIIRAGHLRSTLYIYIYIYIYIY